MSTTLVLGSEVFFPTDDPDAFAAEHSDARALADALVTMYKDNASTLTPDPLHSAFHDSHPPPADRIQRLQALVPASVGVQ